MFVDVLWNFAFGLRTLLPIRLPKTFRSETAQESTPPTGNLLVINNWAVNGDTSSFQAVNHSPPDTFESKINPDEESRLSLREFILQTRPRDFHFRGINCLRCKVRETHPLM
ncbi:unnamed protein product [Larinioides sclopetarius]|uniref:Uncharacterized protein n=1 Tax=Larinioides sclopetarius TaxID=280406 RepID=A0AAV1ZFG5_9ARAC